MDWYLDVDGPVRHEVRRRPSVGKERDRVGTGRDLIWGGHQCVQLELVSDAHLQTCDQRAVRVIPYQILGGPAIVAEGRAEVPSSNLIARVPKRHRHAAIGSWVQYRCGIGEWLLLQVSRVRSNHGNGQIDDDFGEVGGTVVDPDEPVQFLDAGACWDAEVEPCVHRF